MAVHALHALLVDHQLSVFHALGAHNVVFVVDNARAVYQLALQSTDLGANLAAASLGSRARARRPANDKLVAVAVVAVVTVVRIGADNSLFGNIDNLVAVRVCIDDERRGVGRRRNDNGGMCVRRSRNNLFLESLLDDFLPLPSAIIDNDFSLYTLAEALGRFWCETWTYSSCTPRSDAAPRQCGPGPAP